MGAWGYGPYDSDAALDWLDDIERPIVQSIKKALGEGTPHEVIAAAGLLADLDKRPIDLCYEATKEDLYHKMVARLEKLKADGEWVKMWKNPELIGLQIGILILRLQAVALSHAEIRAMTIKVCKFRTSTKHKPRKHKR